MDVSKRLGGFDLGDWNLGNWNPRTDSGKPVVSSQVQHAYVESTDPSYGWQVDLARDRFLPRLT